MKMGKDKRVESPTFGNQTHDVPNASRSEKGTKERSNFFKKVKKSMPDLGKPRC